MSESQGQPQQPQLPPRVPIIHNAALAGSILAPMVMLLPPRRMDIRFFVLAGIFSLTTNQLCYEYTGQSIYSRFNGRMASLINPGLPEKAQRTQQLIREQREREAAARAATEKHQGEQQKDGISGKVKSVWMGSEDEHWSERRGEEHMKALQEGKGLSGIIMDQISDVFSGKDEANNKGDQQQKDPRPDESKSK